jgi:PAS domain S-box-containing protein
MAEDDLRIGATAFESLESMLITDVNGVILRVNQAFTHSTGYSAEEAVGQTPALLHSGRHDAAFYSQIWETLFRVGTWQGEIWDRHKAGHVYPKWLTISGVKNSTGAITHFIGTHYDISERKNAEAAMLKLNSDLSESRQRVRELGAQNEAQREGERKHIAREVHDELGQVLTALRMDISLLHMRFGLLAPALNDKVMDMKVLVDRAIQGVRNVAMNLRPTALDMGLIPAIEWLCTEFTRHTSIACMFYVDDDEIELDEPRAVVIFRIVQESLTNITRYAHASQVNITLGCRGNELGVEVRDNGQGFDLNAAMQRKSFGLLGMRERALALGGHIDIVSAPGQGTVIGVKIPRERRADDRG